VSFEITAALRTRLISTALGYQTLDRVLERLNTQQNLEIDRRAREIRERRERDERRRPW
jgi:adenylate kinase